jgi:putative ATPase
MEKITQTSFFPSTIDQDEAPIKRNDLSPSVINGTKETSPLAHRARPDLIEDFIGHSEIFKKYPYLKGQNFPGLILFGPSGTGKTTLARLLAKQSKKEFYQFNAVLGGIADLKKLIQSAEEMKKRFNSESLIFIDEIHRFNKAQQDALLPYVEEGTFTLIGATTENPRVSVNKALLSRIHIIYLNELSPLDILKILERIVQKFAYDLPPNLLKIMADYAGGDARIALNTLEAGLKLENPSEDTIKMLILENARAFDKGGSRHYDVISAFIKSMRGSDPQAAILWLAVMIDGGEDPVFIARRLLIFASEDIGNADPSALTLATSALTAVGMIGMPEARIILAQVTTYLASTYKSNAAYKAINEALVYVQSLPTLEVPNHLKNHPSPQQYGHNSSEYLYPHDFKNHFVKQDYAKKPIPKFYSPSEEGKEEGIKKRLEKLWNSPQ